MINNNPVRPYIDPSTQAPGTIQPAPLPDPGPLDSRRSTAVDNLIGTVSEPIRKRMQCILQPFPTGALEALYKNDVRFEITAKPSAEQEAMSKDGLQMLGGYNFMTKKIQFMESTLLGDLGPHTVVHELCHAVDHMRGERINPTPAGQVARYRHALSGKAMESGVDEEIRTLYQKFQARSNVEDVDVMRRELLIANNMKKPLPEKATFTSDFDHWGLRPVKYERKDGIETFTIEPVQKAPTRRLLRAGIGAAMVAAGVALPALIGPATMVLGGLVLATAAIGQAKQMMKGKNAPKTEVDVEMVGGAKAHVVQQDERAIISVPEGARSFTGSTWSDYAHRGNMGQESRGAGEYAAEAYSTYLEGGDKASIFRDSDPEMYAFVEKRLRDEFNLHP